MVQVELKTGGPPEASGLPSQPQGGRASHADRQLETRRGPPDRR